MMTLIEYMIDTVEALVFPGRRSDRNRRHGR
jgi:hypothetical protein